MRVTECSAGQGGEGAAGEGGSVGWVGNKKVKTIEGDG